ncbi:MAG: TrkH family potassium uptake protein [Bacteroidetes bacterium]|uniref:TrkH family potassium uptake protein n=1 Tax=Candidatus Merdivivens pullistercoris TaxID=2840873 RepID=A0A9D9I1Q2_9BACT|nr:TrkH family potassium uptake protein [Candidatus Merdivivens pullistercoris]
MNISVISRYMGIALLANAVFMFLSAGVSAMNDFDAAFVPLVISGIITFAAGIFPMIFVRENHAPTVKEGFIIIIFAWLLSCIFAMLPYLMWGGEFTLVNAFFESVSGLTTTGASILTDVEVLPKGLLFWRSSTHFIGGLGIVVFILLVLPDMSSVRFRLSKMEASEVSKEDFKFRSKNKVYVILSVYLILVAANTLALWIAGMSFFDAVNHAFSTVATGGFSTRTASIAAYDSLAIEIVTEFFMIISAIHFGMLYMLIFNRSLRIFRSPVVRYYLLTILVSTILISLNLVSSGVFDSFWTALRQAFFNVASVISTTGFATVDTSVWPAFSIMVLIFLLFQCGCSGSTTGGIKSDRMWIFFCGVKKQIRQMLYPNAVVTVKVGKTVVNNSILFPVVLFIALYVFITFVSTLLLTLCDMELLEAFSGSVTMMSNAGPGFGSISSVSNYNHIPTMGKIIFSVDMLLGRVELYPLLLLFSGIFSRK